MKYYFLSTYSFFILFSFISNPEYLDFYALILSKGEVNCFSNQNISRGLYSFYLIFHCGLYTIYVLNEAILQFFSLKYAVFNQERFQIKSGLVSFVRKLHKIWDSHIEFSKPFLERAPFLKK